MQKIMLFIGAIAPLLLSGCAVFTSDEAYVVEEKGRGSIRSTLWGTKDSAAEQWAYANELLDEGKKRRAGDAFRYLARRWPNSKEAPAAQRKLADVLMKRNALKDAFEAYQTLISNYASRMGDYDAVLGHQFEIAERLMNRRTYRWLFGGFRSPDQAVEYFEHVIRNGPQWARAAEAQYLIGKAYVEAEELELAVTAFSVLGYRYPDSEFAEDGLWQQILALQALHKELPDSQDVLDRLLTSTTLFLTTFPDSDLKADVIELRNKLYEKKASMAYEEADFYVRVARKPEAAILSFKQMIEEYPRSKLVPKAEARIEELEAYLENPNARQL